MVRSWRQLPVRCGVPAVLAVAGAALAAGQLMTQDPVYQADTELFVATHPTAIQAAPGTDGTFTAQRMHSYTDLLTSPAVLAPVIRALHLRENPDQLARQVRASNPPDSVLLQIDVSDTSPVRARDIANGIAAQFPVLVRQLETAPGTATADVTASVTRAAETPTDPVSPDRNLDVALGLLIGAIVGTGAVTRRRRVTDPDRVTRLTGAPVLGRVWDDTRRTGNRLITDRRPARLADAFAQVRTGLRFLSVDHPLRSLVVVGSMPAQGSTVIAANLALTLAEHGASVVLIDADLRKPAIADLLGLPAGAGLTSVLLGDVAVDDATHSWHRDLPLQVLTAGPRPPNPTELLGSARMARLVEELTARGRTVVIDAPALLSAPDAAALARIADGALVVTRVGGRPARLASAVRSLHSARATVLGIVLNHGSDRAALGHSASAAGRHHPHAPVFEPGAASPSAPPVAGTVSRAPAGPGACHPVGTADGNSLQSVAAAPVVIDLRAAQVLPRAPSTRSIRPHPSASAADRGTTAPPGGLPPAYQELAHPSAPYVVPAAPNGAGAGIPHPSPIPSPLEPSPPVMERRRGPTGRRAAGPVVTTPPPQDDPDQQPVHDLSRSTT
jgi:polysaccharide biosynthesis transport protein